MCFVSRYDCPEVLRKFREMDPTAYERELKDPTSVWSAMGECVGSICLIGQSKWWIPL